MKIKKIINSSNTEYLIIKSFLLVPAIYLLNTYINHSLYGIFYLGSVDPEYFHLFNGIAIGDGKLNVEYIAHPATPLQYVIAFSARAIHFFQGNDYYLLDFLNNPEKYIHVANLFLNLITVSILFFGAIHIYRITSSKLISLFFQLIPFGNDTLIEISGRLLPETIMVIPLLVLFVLVIKYIYTRNENYDLKKETLLWGGVIGFGIACKMSFIPVVILPLMLLQTSFKRKVLYLVYTIIAVCLFAYPIIVNFSEFKEWILGMLTHSGMHGKGEANFINWNTTVPNFKYLFSEDRMLFFIMLISLLITPLYFIKNMVFDKTMGYKTIRAIYTANITIILVIAFTLKHFAFHYFMPFYTFKFFLLVLIFIMLNNLRISKTIKLARTVAAIMVFLFCIGIIYFEKHEIGEKRIIIEKRTKELESKSKKINDLTPNDVPLIITAPYYGSPYIAYALNDGFLMSYKLKGYFKTHLEKMYPKTFFYVGWSEFFYHWDNYVNFDYILEKASTEVFLYVGPDKKDNIATIEDRLFMYVNEANVSKEIKYHDDQTGEMLIRYFMKNNKEIKAVLNEPLILKYIEAIKNDDKWYERVKQKAADRKISIDSILYLDAKWMIENPN